MKNKAILFVQAFIQVSMISANSYFIFRENWTGVAICSFLISYVWTRNVVRISASTETERIIYATGAMIGALCGLQAGIWLN